MRTLILLLLLCAVLAAVEDGESAGVTWLTDLDAARAAARETGRPIVAVFR
ncbi:MAG: hypothetical protein QNJ90_08495 [Planctomycetota bacterium]|nr:hypothetical protein [Planctomycetota bacterium]